MSAPPREGTQKGQGRTQQQALPPAEHGCMISITPRHNAALHHPKPPELGAQQLLPRDFARTHLLLDAHGRNPVTVIILVRPEDVHGLPSGYQELPAPAWLAAGPPRADALPGDEVARLQRECVATAAGSVVVGQTVSHLQPAQPQAAGPGSGLVLDCSPLAALARWRVAVVEVVAMRALALHLWCPSGMKRPAGGAGSQAVVVKKEAPTAASEGAAPAAADSTDEDLPIAAKRRRRLNAPEPEPDLLPGLQPGGGSGVLGERAAGPQQAGMPGLPGLPSLAMPPAHTPADQGDQDSKSSVWRDTAAALTASAAMAAAAAAAAAGAPTPPMPAAAAAAAAAESGAARSGRTSRPIVTRLYSGTARAWVDMLRGSVETALAGGWGGDRPGPPSTLVAVAKGRVVQLEGQVWYFPLRYMQPRHNDSQLSVPVTLLQGLSAEGDAVVTHPVTLVPLVPRPAATALGVELEGPPVPSHVTNLLPFCQQWAAVAEIPTHTNCNKQLVGTKAGFDAFRPLTGWHMLCGYTDVPSQTVYVAMLPPSAAVVKTNLQEAKAAACTAGYQHLLNYPGQVSLATFRGPRTKAATLGAGPLPTGASSVTQPHSQEQEATEVPAGSDSRPPASMGLPLAMDAHDSDVPEVAEADTPASSEQQRVFRLPMFTSWRDLSLGSSGVAAWLQDFPSAMERLASSQQLDGKQQLPPPPQQPAAPAGRSGYTPLPGLPAVEPRSAQVSGSCGAPSSSNGQWRSRQGLCTPTAASRGWRLPADRLRHAVAQAWGGQVPADHVELASLSRVQVTLLVAGQQPVSGTAPLLAMLLPANAAAAAEHVAAAGACAAGDRAPSHYWLVGEGVSRTLRDLVAYSITDVTGVPPPAAPECAPASWPFNRQAVRDLRPHLAVHLCRHRS